MASPEAGELTRSRSRSRSPRRSETRPKKQKAGSFKWKDKKPRDGERTDDQGNGALKRGYRDRSPRRDSYRQRDNDRQDDVRDRPRDRSPRREKQGDSYRPRESDGGRGSDQLDRPRSDRLERPVEPEKKEKKEKKPKAPKAPVSSEPMIVVNVNDRLGTKAAIPCLASDSVKAFKAIVAAHIGRQPYEIMIKRQGERPFKDQLTLEDYGVSSGVQLDLEIDTGD